MKKIIITLSIFITLLIAVVGFILFYPLPAISPPPSGILYNEDYFITKFTQYNIELLNKNTFTITEEELNGYVNYQLENNELSFGQSSFKATYLNINLLENRTIINIYGDLYSLPVRLQADLEPFYQDGKIYFILKEAKFSRINIPEKYFSRLIGGSMNFSSNLDQNNYFVLPIDIHEMVIINNVNFGNQQLNIQYELNKEKLLDELLKEFRSKIGL